jgi:hypothetical protein
MESSLCRRVQRQRGVADRARVELLDLSAGGCREPLNDRRGWQAPGDAGPAAHRRADPADAADRSSGPSRAATGGRLHRCRGGCSTKAAAPSRRDRVRAMLADLKMPGALEALDGIGSGVDGGSLTAGEAIESLLGAQIGLLVPGDAGAAEGEPLDRGEAERSRREIQRPWQQQLAGPDDRSTPRRHPIPAHQRRCGRPDQPLRLRHRGGQLRQRVPARSRMALAVRSAAGGSDPRLYRRGTVGPFDDRRDAGAGLGPAPPPRRIMAGFRAAADISAARLPHAAHPPVSIPPPAAF